MNIVIFSDNVAPYRMAWADELGKTNDVTFCYFKDKDAERNDNWLVKKSQYTKMVKLPAVIIKNKAVSFSVVKFLKNNDFDVVIFDGYGIIPNILGMLYLTFHHHYYYINIDGVRIGREDNRFSYLLKKKIFNTYANYLCGSQYTIDNLMKYGIDPKRACEHKFTSLHEEDIIDHVPTKKEVENARSMLGLKNIPTLLAVGRFLKLKQFDMLIEAFSVFDHEFQLIIVGEGDEEETYRQKIKNYNLHNVVIAPFVPFEKLKDYYLAADVFTLTSNSEVWGLVINEAMGCAALPVVASDRCVASYSLIKQNINGYIFTYNNMSELRRYIGFAMNTRDDVGLEMRKESLKMIQDFTVEKLAQRHIDFFEAKKLRLLE